MRRSHCARFFIGALLVPVSASAAGLSVARFGGERGTPMTTQPTAIYYNPSGIADSEGTHVFGDLGLAWRRATYERPSSDTAVPAGAEGANTGRATLFNVVMEPFIGATTRLGDLTLGAAFYVPFGGQNSWDKNEDFLGNASFPGAVDGVQRWHLIEGDLRSMFLSAAAAYKFGPVSVGVSANAIDTIVNVLQARNASGDDDVRTEGRAWLETEAWDFSMGAGVTYQAIPERLRFGLSYQSRPGFGGGIRTTGELRTLFAGNQTDTRVAFTTDLPDVVRAGGAFRPTDEIELRLFGDYQRWSVLEQQCIMLETSDCEIAPDGSALPGSDVILNTVRDWNDTFGVRAGGSYFVTERLEVVLGAGFASSAAPDETLEPAIIDSNLVTAAAGAIVGIGDNVRAGATYTQVIYFARDTTGQSIHSSFETPSRNPDSGGEYGLDVGLLNLNVDVAF